MANTFRYSPEATDVGLLRERVDELERERTFLLEASGVLLKSRTSDEVLQAIIELGRGLISADAYAIWRKQRNDGGWVPVSWSGLSEQFIEEAGTASSGHFGQTDEPMLFQEIENEPLLAPQRSALRASGIRSMMAVPLRLDDKGSGRIVFYWRNQHRITAAETRIASSLARVAAAAVGNAELVERNAAELNLVTDSVPALISYVDTEQRFVRVNRGYEELFGLKREQIAGRLIAEVMGREHYALAKPHLELALRGEPANFRSRVRRHDGAMRDIELFYAPDAAPDGKVRGIVVMLQDMTERYRAEETRARLAAIVDSSDDAIVSKTLEGVITSWNHGAERIFGFTAAEAVGQHITLIIPEERFAEEYDVLSRVRRGERVDHFETERRTKDGRIIHISLTVSPVRDATGKIIGASKTARDITGRKRAEAERVEFLAREQKARETAELLNRVGPILSAELDPRKLAQKITDIATQAVRAEFGALFHNVADERGGSYSLYTWFGASRELFETLPMLCNSEVFAPAGDTVVRSDDITNDPRYGKNTLSLPEEHLPVRSYLAVPVVSRTGTVLGGLFFGHSHVEMFKGEEAQIATGIAAQAAIAMDNAELFAESQRVQHALRRSNEEIKRANEDLNQYAYSASHDLQEPLRAVAIYSQLLGRKLRHALDAESEEFIGHILRGARQMESLIRDLLAYSQASVISDEPAPVIDANAALGTALSNLKAAMEETGASVTHVALPRVRIREVHLTQVFQNVIGNAIKYRRGEPPRIKVGAEPRENHWLFSVEDNGIGIEERYKEQIFGIFKRLHTADEYSGTGIGLAICQRMVERAGGQIWMESQPGRGSTLFFTLPSGE